MIEQGSSAIASEAEKDVLTFSMARKLLIASFRFSQGEGQILQGDIILYVKLLHPEWRMDEDLGERLRSSLVEPVERFISSGNHQDHLAEDVSESLAKAVNMTGAIFNSDVSSEENLVPRIAAGIVSRDYRFLKSNETGVERKRKAHVVQRPISPVEDPMLSHVMFYGYEGNTTGLDDLDKMFREVVRYIEKDDGWAVDFGNRYELSDVREIYEKTHGSNHVMSLTE